MKLLLLLLAAFLSINENQQVAADSSKLEEVFVWKVVDFAYDTPEQRQEAIDSKEFIDVNNLPLGLDRWKDKLFVTVPRWKAGVPSTLNYINISDLPSFDEVEEEDEPPEVEEEDKPSEVEEEDDPSEVEEEDDPSEVEEVDEPPEVEEPLEMEEEGEPPEEEEPEVELEGEEQGDDPDQEEVDAYPDVEDDDDDDNPEETEDAYPDAEGDDNPEETEDAYPDEPEELETPDEELPRKFMRGIMPLKGWKSRNTMMKEENVNKDNEIADKRNLEGVNEKRKNIKLAGYERENGKNKKKGENFEKGKKKKAVKADRDSEKGKKKKKKTTKEVDCDTEKEKKKKEKTKEVDCDTEKEKKKKKKKKAEDAGCDTEKGKKKKKKKKKEKICKKPGCCRPAGISIAVPVNIVNNHHAPSPTATQSPAVVSSDKPQLPQVFQPILQQPPVVVSSNEPQLPQVFQPILQEPPTTNERSPLLIPYPSLAVNSLPRNDTRSMPDDLSITSVFRVRVDPCDRLWVMDTGAADILGNYRKLSPPRILVFDLNTDQLIRKYDLKDSDITSGSFFANIIVDATKEKCDQAFAYIPDLGGYGVVVYDWANNDSRRVTHNFFFFDPLGGDYTVGGVNFQWTDGVFSIALTKPKPDGFRTAYFHAFSSTKEFEVSTKSWKNPKDESYFDYKLTGDRGEKSQSSASFIHEESGVMFYTQVQKDAVSCWNTNKPLVAENIAEVASNNETMIFPNDLKVDYEDNLWILTDKLPIYVYKELNKDEDNFRILRTTVKKAVEGTSCMN